MHLSAYFVIFFIFYLHFSILLIIFAPTDWCMPFCAECQRVGRYSQAIGVLLWVKEEKQCFVLLLEIWKISLTHKMDIVTSPAR